MYNFSAALLKLPDSATQRKVSSCGLYTGSPFLSFHGARGGSPTHIVARGKRKVKEIVPTFKKTVERRDIWWKKCALMWGGRERALREDGPARWGGIPAD